MFARTILILTAFVLLASIWTGILSVEAEPIDAPCVCDCNQPHEPELGSFAAILARVEQGNVDAQFILGYMYAKGEGVPRNDTEAFKWSLAAAE